MLQARQPRHREVKETAQGPRAGAELGPGHPSPGTATKLIHLLGNVSIILLSSCCTQFQRPTAIMVSSGKNGQANGDLPFLWGESGLHRRPPPLRCPRPGLPSSLASSLESRYRAPLCSTPSAPFCTAGKVGWVGITAGRVGALPPNTPASSLRFLPFLSLQCIQ